MVSVAGRQGTRSLSRRLSRERRLSDDEPFIVFWEGEAVGVGSHADLQPMFTRSHVMASSWTRIIIIILSADSVTLNGSTSTPKTRYFLYVSSCSFSLLQAPRRDPTPQARSLSLSKDPQSADRPPPQAEKPQ